MGFPLYPTNAHLVWHFRGKTAILCSSKVHPTSGMVALGMGDRSRLAADALVFWVRTASRRNLLRRNYFNLQLTKGKIADIFFARNLECNLALLPQTFQVVTSISRPRFLTSSGL